MIIVGSMSDIFISYSKTDHALALKLSAFLESEGWTVWWDKSLAAADLYRDEIMKQLVAARAVITIWSPNSVRSDWVRAEAGRAKADGKLIPVKTPELTYADIPLPFGEMHTENVGSTELIRAAIVAQLAKPLIPQSPLWQITSTFKYQVLTWIGIIGSSITLFANFKGVLDLAYWANQLIDHWHELTQSFWDLAFSVVKLKVPKDFVPIISFIYFRRYIDGRSQFFREHRKVASGIAPSSNSGEEGAPCVAWGVSLLRCTGAVNGNIDCGYIHSSLCGSHYALHRRPNLGPIAQYS